MTSRLSTSGNFEEAMSASMAASGWASIPRDAGVAAIGSAPPAAADEPALQNASDAIRRMGRMAAGRAYRSEVLFCID